MRWRLTETGRGGFRVSTAAFPAKLRHSEESVGVFHALRRIPRASVLWPEWSAVISAAGEVRLKVPKLRRTTFETAVIERCRRRESSVEEAIIEMYPAGVSTRRVEDITEALWDVKVSPSTVSSLNKNIYEPLAEFLDDAGFRSSGPAVGRRPGPDHGLGGSGFVLIRRAGAGLTTFFGFRLFSRRAGAPS